MNGSFLCATPAWLPDETFFSLCSRLHFLSGHLRPSVTAKQLLSLSERSIKHDLPCGLDAFELNTAERWGNAISIIEHRTIFSFFSPFQSYGLIAEALAQMRSSSIGSLKYRLGLVCGGFGADHPLKACRSCIMRDVDLYGVSYWHLTHQYPGVVLCPEHSEVLRECLQNRRWCGRFTWTMPSTGKLHDLGYGKLAPLERERLAELATACRDLASLGLMMRFDPLTVAQIYRKRLPIENAAQSLLTHISPLQRFNPYRELPSTEATATSFIRQMVRSPRRHIHPLKHLVMVTWLFGDVSTFAQCHEICFPQRIEPFLHPVSPALHDVSAVPAHRQGHARPKRLKPELRAHLLNRLAEGTSKGEICREFELTISTLNKLLRAEPGVQASWTARRMALDLAAHRLRWTELQLRFPLHPVTELRRECQSLYMWLHRNDREWMNTQASQMPKPTKRRDPRVDWESRDVELQGELEAEITRRFGSDLSLCLKQSQIFTLIPRLAQRLERRDRYPRTRAYMRLLSK